MLIICYVVLCAALAIVSTVGDIVISHSYFVGLPAVRAVWDNSTHGLVGVICWMLTCGNFPCLAVWKESLLCGLIACSVDVDHFIAAGSFKLKDVTNLKNRPFLHCTSVVVLIILLSIALAKLLGRPQLFRIGMTAFVAVTTHHVRDALRRGLWLWPFGSTPPLRLEAYYFGLAAIVISSAFVTRDSAVPHITHFDEAKLSLV
uniref:Transmembrane protein 267 n=1 Tax=Ornithodoros turicata TaxID=34597 RepID=A0A2R5L8R3_9ACAR